ncbi:MAG: methyltransferase family protein [Planctomycetota bacterium]|jgi:protein-S-isoprenylcysteine O-methyltransferase Ste14
MTGAAQRRFFLAAVGAALIHVVLLCAPFAVLGRLRGITADPQALLFLLVAGAWCLLESSTQAACLRSPRPQERSQWLPWVVGVSLLVAFWTSLAERAVRGPAHFGLGAAAGGLAVLVGIALRRLAMRTLGPYFLDLIVLLPEHPLVTRGVYGRIRHPSETGTLLIAFGSAFLLGSTWGFVACGVLVLPSVVTRVRLEDGLLRLRHPQTFPGYARRVPALLPRPHRRHTRATQPQMGAHHPVLNTVDRRSESRPDTCRTR